MPRIDPLEKYKYLIGTKINKWAVLSLKNDRRHADAICKCECGTIKPVNIRNLINNVSKDCGCGRKQTMSKIKSKNFIGQKFGKLTVVDSLPYTNKFNRKLYKCICDCGNEIIVPSSSLSTNHTLSCGCLNSYYNMYINKYLDELNIKHKNEYTVDIDGKKYRFDFYLPDYNLFIEYDGIQHYKPTGFKKTEEENLETFLNVQNRDKIKNEYCYEHNINLLRIPYYESKNVKEIINNHLQRLSEKGFNNN